MCPFTGEAAGGRKVIKEVLVTSSKTTLLLEHEMTCQTSNCLYLLTCRKEGVQYVDETGRKVAAYGQSVANDKSGYSAV